jgi:hypothetical protein
MQLVTAASDAWTGITATLSPSRTANHVHVTSLAQKSVITNQELACVSQMLLDTPATNVLLEHLGLRVVVAVNCATVDQAP